MPRRSRRRIARRCASSSKWCDERARAEPLDLERLDRATLGSDAIAAGVVACRQRERATEVVSEKQPHASLDLVRQKPALLVDELLRIAVVAHRDRRMHP